LLPKKLAGLKAISLRLALKLSPNDRLPLAFSMMPLSMAVMIGATSTAALPAASASEPILRPSLLVFQELVLVATSSVNGIEGFGSAAGILGVGNEKWELSSAALWISFWVPWGCFTCFCPTLSSPIAASSYDL
jgi:hypothetical protein